MVDVATFFYGVWNWIGAIFAWIESYLGVIGAAIVLLFAVLSALLLLMCVWDTLAKRIPDSFKEQFRPDPFKIKWP